MILLDTHVWWWSLSEPKNLSETALVSIQKAQTDERFISSISIWEFAMMVEEKRIELKIASEKWLAKAIGDTGITVLDLSPAIATDACRLPGEFHKDPTDRIIVATSRVHNLRLITKDQKILEYPHVRSVW